LTKGRHVVGVKRAPKVDDTRLKRFTRWSWQSQMCKAPSPSEFWNPCALGQ